MAVCKYEFEPRINVECVMHLVGIVRAGEVVSRRGEVLQHAGAVTGELGAYMTPDAPQPFGDVPVPATIEACCTELEGQLGGDAPQLNPVVVAIIIKLISKLLEELL